MPICNVTGGVVHYETWGENGDPVVTLVNGYLRSLRDFSYLARELVSGGFRVVSLDNRGSGKTKVNDAFSLSDMAADVVAVWDLLGIEKSDLLGISMGGAISQYVAANYGERIRRLVLVSTAPEEKYITDGEGWLFSTEEEVAKLTKELVIRKFSAYFSRQYGQKYPHMIKSIASDFLKSLSQEGYAKLAIAQKKAICVEDEKYMPFEIKTETLIIHGNEDRIVDKKAALELSKNIAGSKVEIVENVGHLLLLENPKRLLELTMDFLKR